MNRKPYTRGLISLLVLVSLLSTTLVLLPVPAMAAAPTITATNPSTATIGTPYTLSPTVSGGTSPYSWSTAGKPDWLMLNPNTGALSGTPGTSAKTVTFTLQVKDKKSTKATKNLTINVIKASISNITITVDSPTAAIIGSPFSLSPKVSGGSAPYSWSTTGKPFWLMLDQNTGVMTGTPGVSAVTETFTLQVKDKTGIKATTNVTINVNQPVPPAITVNSPTTATIGSPYSLSPAASGGAGVPYSWSTIGKPDWLMLDQSTGAMIGTPGVSAKTVTFTLQVKDKIGTKATANVTINVNPAPCTVFNSLSTQDQVKEINSLIPAHNPDINSAGYKMMNQLFQCLSYEKKLILLKELSRENYYPTAASHILFNLNGSNRDQLFVGIAKSDPLAASRIIAHWPTGVNAPEIYSMFGSLLNNNKSASNSVLSALDADPVRKYFADAIRTYFKIAVNPTSTPAITVTTPTTATIGTPYTLTPTASGGTAPYTWSTIGKPDWLMLNQNTGVMTGTPGTSAKTVTFTLQVKDKIGTKATTNVTINVITAPTETVVIFPDANLEAAIRSAINKPTGDIYASELATLTALDANERGIINLSGIEYCTNLTKLLLSYKNQISDLTPLAGLKKLTYLTLESNKVSDLRPLAGLTNLTHLHLWSNQISDLTPLAGLTNVTYLGLNNNQIGDHLTPLANLTNLIELQLWSNQISNLAPLASITSLQKLGLGANHISNLTPLAGLNNLTDLVLYANQISDLTPLAGLTNLTHLSAGANQISNLTPLSGLPNLRELVFNINNIINLSPLAGMTNLSSLTLNNNQIIDLTPLAGLTNLTYLELNNIYQYQPKNQISDISPLVSNTGLSTGDTVYLRGNPLDTTSLYVHIPVLQGRGVTVEYDIVIPTAPSNVQAVALDSNHIQITWTDNSGGTASFEIWDTQYLRATVNPGTTSYTFSNIAPGTYRCFCMRAFNSAGASRWTDDAYACTTTPSLVPPKISGIQVGAMAVTEVGILWNTDQPSSSQVEWGPTISYGTKTPIADDPSTGSILGVVNHGVIIKGLIASTIYHFRVISRNKDGMSATSEDNTFTTPNNPQSTIPAAPSNVQAVATDSTHMQITWTDNSGGTASFEIWNAEELKATVSPGTTSYTFSNIAPGKYNCFCMRAFNSAGTSRWTDDAYACTTTPPAAALPKCPCGKGPGGIIAGDWDPTTLTQEKRQWLWEAFGHTGIAPVGYGGERCTPCCPSGTGPDGITAGDWDPTTLTQEKRQWLWEAFGHTGTAPVGYGGERCIK